MTILPLANLKWLGYKGMQSCILVLTEERICIVKKYDVTVKINIPELAFCRQ